MFIFRKATFGGSNIIKYRGRIVGEVKLYSVTTNNNNAVLPFIINEGYRPKLVTAAVTAEYQSKVCGSGYISYTNGNTRITFSNALSNTGTSISVGCWFDYAI